MSYLLIGLLAAAGVSLALVLLPRRGRPQAGRPAAPAPAPAAPAQAGAAGHPSGVAASVPPAPAAAVPAPPAAQAMAQALATAMAAPRPAAEPPEALAGWDWIAADDLPETRREALTTSLRSIPRPPSTLHQLVSPSALDQARSAELAEIIGAEPRLAAKVLATVNSPLYGLQRPVSSIGQAITFLGLNTVRGLCLQHLLDASFQHGQPALREAYAQIWQASMLASELCGRLAVKLELPEPGALATQVLLSFLGHLATASMLSRLPGLPLAGTDLAARVGLAQQRLGTGPAEIGALLLADWELPAAIVDEVRAIDRVLVSPPGTWPAPHARRLVLAYLCARLGERLAAGERVLLAEPDPLADPHPDFHHLRQHLADPVMSRLGEQLRAPDLAQALQGLQGGRVDARVPA